MIAQTKGGDVVSTTVGIVYDTRQAESPLREAGIEPIVPLSEHVLEGLPLPEKLYS